jgi:hypothetical protein
LNFKANLKAGNELRRPLRLLHVCIQWRFPSRASHGVGGRLFVPSILTARELATGRAVCCTQAQLGWQATLCGSCHWQWARLSPSHSVTGACPGQCSESFVAASLPVSVRVFESDFDPSHEAHPWEMSCHPECPQVPTSMSCPMNSNIRAWPDSSVTMPPSHWQTVPQTRRQPRRSCLASE